MLQVIYPVEENLFADLPSSLPFHPHLRLLRHFTSTR